MSEEQKLNDKKNSKNNRNRNRGGKKASNPTFQQARELYLKDMAQMKEAFKLYDASTAIKTFDSNPDFRKKIEEVDKAIPIKNQKLRKLEAMVGEKFMQSDHAYGSQYDSLPAKTKIAYLQAVFADDLFSAIGIGASEIAPYLADLAYEYGPSVLNWLYGHAKKAYQSVFSHGSGPGLVTTFNPPQFSLVDNNTVDLLYLAAVFCPEKYSNLTPDSMANQLVNTTKTTSYPLNTGADGNIIFSYLSDAVMQTGGTLPSWQIYSNANNALTNVTLGTTNAPVYTAGVFSSGGAGNFARFRSGPGSVRIVYQLAALNNQGAATLCYFSECPVGNTLGLSAPIVQYQQAMQSPFLHIAAINGTTEMRQIILPHDLDELTLEDFAATMPQQQANGGYDMTYFTVESAPVNTVIGKAFITSSIDYYAGTQLNGTVKAITTPDAPASIPCACSLIKKMPHLTQLTLDEAMNLADYIINLKTTSYGKVVQSVLSHAAGYKPRPKAQISGGGSHSNGNGNSIVDFSMDDM